MNEVEELILNFLHESTHIIEHIEQCSNETILECYNYLEICAKTACNNITSINPAFRVEICKHLDILLEYIVDKVPLPPSTDTKTIYTPAIHNYRFWKNVELMKDKGLTGYVLGEEIGAKSVMFFCSEDENYEYLEDLHNLELVKKEPMFINEYIYTKFLQENYEKMDILILHGLYEQTVDFLYEYRQLRPDGKVYCGLDMNKDWIQMIPWNDSRVKKFTSQCDLIATSCTNMRDVLNSMPNINFPCRYMPNGFYNPNNLEIIANPKEKENVIITVGRIGSEQKNNLELLNAFTLSYPKIHNWKLKLIGTVEPSFKPIINEFLQKNPHLKSKIIFTGAITNKTDLYKEYSKAKIFALTSTFEGGTPNVYAEALVHGCMFITSDIDAHEDITNFGELGFSYKSGDVYELSDKLIKLCSMANSPILDEHINKAIAYQNLYFDWKRNAKKLVFSFLQ